MPRVAFAETQNASPFRKSFPKTTVEATTTESTTISTLTTSMQEPMVLLSSTRSDESSSGAGAGGGRSSGSSSIATGAKSPKLRGNLTRQHVNRDPFIYYERVQILGQGSMGCVAQIRKRGSKVGGSARYNLRARAKEQAKWDKCFQLPLGLGWIFHLFLQDHAEKCIEAASLSAASSAMSRPASSNSLFDDAASLDSQSSSSAIPPLAMKSIHLRLIRDKTFVDELRNEIAVLKTLDHPHIVRVIETFDYANELFVVMELCSGGDLYSRDPYTEDQAARIVHSILLAMAYMHSKGVIHRDLKFENVLFATNAPQSPIKLIDFGLSKPILDHETLTDGAGTIYTMAPEVLQGKYSKQADVWSVGVITYMLLSSQMPFYGMKRNHVVRSILSGHYEYKGRRWRKVSSQAKAFIEDLLVVDPEERATADEALRASWLHRRQSATARNPNAAELKNVKRSIERYVRYPKLRKLALMVIAHRSTSDEIGILRKVFQIYDTKHTGQLSFESFKEAMDEAGYNDEGYREMFDAVDMTGTGFIRYTEFLAASLEATGWISEERLAEAFDRVDHDNTGYISRENLLYLLGIDFPEDELESLISEAHYEEGKGISYESFLAQWDDDKEQFDREWRQQMLERQELAVAEQPEQPKFVADNQDAVSELSFEYSVATDPGRSDFMEMKSMSERKMAVVAAA